VYAVINHLHLTIPIDDIRESLEHEGLPLLTSLPGFKSFSMVKEADDRAAILIFWDSEEHAINGGKTLGPTWFHEHVAPYLASEQQRTLGEVVVHSGV
jgi:heme-degrading monooxygenase HmoA